MRAKKRISRRALCLPLALCLGLTALAGCYATENAAMINTPNARVAYSGGAVPKLECNANGISVKLTNTSVGELILSMASNTLEVGAGASMGLLRISYAATIKNADGIIKNAVVEKAAGGTTFEKMPEQLTLKPGAYCYVNGVLYDNRGNTTDMVIQGEVSQPGTPAGTPDEGHVAPHINGRSSVVLQEGYSAFGVQYNVSGTPAPTMSVSGTANATITQAALLTIPAGLGIGTYTATIEAANTAGSAELVYLVQVVKKPTLLSAFGAQSRVVTLQFDGIVENIATAKNITIYEKDAGMDPRIKSVIYPGIGDRVVVIMDGVFTVGRTYIAVYDGVQVEFVVGEGDSTAGILAGSACTCSAAPPHTDPNCPLWVPPPQP